MEREGESEALDSQRSAAGWKNHPGRDVFAKFISLNLENSKDRGFFDKTDNIKEIVESIFLSHNVEPDQKPVLLFIDEIQESPEVIRLLRYFYEDYPEIHVIAAGSLLEVALKKVRAFPVGRVEYLYLFPFSFFEFLEALRHKQAIKQMSEVPVKKFAHKTLLDLYNSYVTIGGMPEIVKTFASKRSMLELPDIYESLWSTYQDDVEKYAENNTEKKIIRHIVATAPFLIDKRIKFESFGSSNYRSREVGEALRSLDAAQIIQLIYPSTATEPPIMADLKKSPRLQFLDTGLLNHALGIQSDMIGVDDLSSAYKGAIIPHIIIQELIALNSRKRQKPCFWVRDKAQSVAEVDVVYHNKNKLLPIEIKSGSSGRLRSLHQFMKRVEHPYAVRVYAGEFSIEETKTSEGKKFFLMNMPYYLSSMIMDYIDYFVKNYK